MGETQKTKLRADAIIVMSSIIVSRITGFFREMLIPNFFGLQEVADAYSLSFKITGLMYDLLVGGAIAAALIPILTGYIENKQEKEGWRVVGTFINIVFITMVFTCIIGIVLAPHIVPLIVDFDAKTTALTIRLIRILFPSVAFLMLAGLSNGVLNSYKRFAAAAYGPTIYNVGSIISIILFSKYSIETVAFGVMCSSILYFLFQLSFALKNLKYYSFRFFLKHPGFIKLIRLAIPSLISSSIVQVNVIISSSFASLFTAGSVAALNIADRIWQLPYGVFAQGMGIAMLPTLSGRYAVGDIDEYRRILTKSLKTVLLFTIPSAFGFIVLKGPIITTILKFTNMIGENDIEITSNILMFFSLALITHSIVAIMNRAFYSVNDTKTPLLIGSCTIIVNTALSYIFYVFFRDSLSTGGMALAYSLSSLLNAVLLLSLLTRKIKAINIGEFIVFLLKTLFSALIMAALLYFINNLFKAASANKVYQILSLMLEVAAGVFIYFTLVIIFKVEEACYIFQGFLSKIKNLCKKFQINH
ncbi:MAG: murein biosynthesis integral membrane protein MurJ [Acetivibrionales bacterium]